MARPLTMNEAAAELGVSRRWFQDFLRTAPPCWLVAGRKKLFDEIAIVTLKEAMRCRPRPSHRSVRGTPRHSRQSPQSILAEALRLAAEKPPPYDRTRS
jgi:hypothetical protein